MTVAVVDVGTNSVRLLVARPSERAHLRDVHRETRITRLGRGIDATGHLDDAALAHTLDVISDYADIARSKDAGAMRVAATSAVRDATDRDRFFAGVRERVGVDAQVLSGEQEAALSFLGGTAGIAGLSGAGAPYLLNDIGGGSTELILGDTAPVAWTSRQLGCVRLTERTLQGDPYDPATLADARRVAFAELDLAAGEIEATGGGSRPGTTPPTLVSVAGTATTIAALHLGLDTYDPVKIHGARVPRVGVDQLAVKLAAMTNDERRALGPMMPGREDVVVAGTIILSEIMDRFGTDETLVSEADILDGLALSLLQ